MENKIEHTMIKMGDAEIKFFISLSPSRLIDQKETYLEYKVRQKINNQMIKRQKKWGYSK